MKIGHWTYGRGTGHIRRINALAKVLFELRADIDYHAFAAKSAFRSFLHHRVQLFRTPLDHYDIFVIDQKLDKFPDRLQGIADRYIQLCKIGTTLEAQTIPPNLERLSIEDCTANSKLGLNCPGALLDVAPDRTLSPSNAYKQLRIKLGYSLPRPLGLVFANTWDANAAQTFISSGIVQLRPITAAIVVSSGHRGPFLERVKTRHPENDIITIGLSPIYPYLSCFDAIFCPVGYNTYAETQLFAKSSELLHYSPMFPTDQALRYQEQPSVSGLGNRKIATAILDVD